MIDRQTASGLRRPGMSALRIITGMGADEFAAPGAPPLPSTQPGRPAGQARPTLQDRHGLCDKRRAVQPWVPTPERAEPDPAAHLPSLPSHRMILNAGAHQKAARGSLLPVPCTPAAWRTRNARRRLSQAEAEWPLPL